MKTKKINNRIYFNYDEKSFANVSINNAFAKIELIKTLPKFRNKKLASKLLSEIINYLKKEEDFKYLYANPLPLNHEGLNLKQLINFYKKHGFIEADNKTKYEPYLMVKELNT